jgi:hypothetical protein
VSPPSRLARWCETWIPPLGVALFVLLYFVAASLYPGGTRSDRTTVGYAHLSNYWCDLLDAVSYSGKANPGRPYAVVATVALPLTLIPFCFRLARLARGGERWVIGAAGSLAMLLATLIFTPLHDLAINLAAPLGFCAFVLGLRGLTRAGHRRLVLLAGVALALSTLNYLMWQTRWLLWLMPVVQKLAYLALLSWVIATTFSTSTQTREPPLSSVCNP